MKSSNRTADCWNPRQTSLYRNVGQKGYKTATPKKCFNSSAHPEISGNVLTGSPRGGATDDTCTDIPVGQGRQLQQPRRRLTSRVISRVTLCSILWSMYTCTYVFLFTIIVSWSFVFSMCQLKFYVHSQNRINVPEYVPDWIENGVPIPSSKSVQPFELNNY